MALTGFKVKNEDFENMDIASLSDRPSADGMSAQMLKERFDAGAKHVLMPKFNQLVETLAGTEGADNIGAAAIEGLSGYTVQQILVAIKLLLDDKKSIESADREIAQKFDAAEAQSLVKEVTFSEGSGVFTITKYDGSVQTYDTALEKVALDVRLDGQQFVLTLVDGTEQRVDLSAFLTQTEVNSSDTITLSIESGAIVARLAIGSVMLSHLNAEVTAYIDAKELAAYQSAQAAAVSEQNALNSANAAAVSEQNARLYQEQACACASSAKTSETNASASERNAANSEAEAKDAAERAKAIAGGDFLERDIYDKQSRKRDIFSYVDEQVALISNTGIPKLTIDVLPVTATEDNQTVFEIVHDTFDVATDTVAVQSGMLKLSPNRDYTVEGKTVVLTNGVPAGRTLDIWVFKNVPMGDDGSVSGKVIAPGTLPNDRLEKECLPLDGSVSMSGNLTIEKSTPELLLKRPDGRSINMFISSDNIAYFRNMKDSNNRTALFLQGETIENFGRVLRLQKLVDGTASYYTIFGEHNTDLLATQIQSLIDSGVIEVGGLMIPISIKSSNLTTTEFTGSGKGRLFLSCAGTSTQITLKIDGVTVASKVSGMFYSATGFVDFKQSFSVVGTNTSSGRCTAVFY